MNDVRSCAIGVFVRAGSADETLAENGISHFIEHTNFKGTTKRTAFQISWDVDALGMMINAATGKEMTYYYIKTIAEHVDKATEILSDLFLNATYPAEEIDKERGVVIEEINMYEDMPDDLCFKELSYAFHGDGDGYGRPILGSKENVNGFSKQDILAYKRKFYTTDNIVVVFAGAIDDQTAIELSEKYFGLSQTSTSAKRPKRNVLPKFETRVREKDIEQAHLCLAFKSVPVYDDKLEHFNMLSGLLGGGMSSRLFQKVREEMGLCYSVSASLTAYIDSGRLDVYAGLASDKLADAYHAILDEITSFKEGGVTREEFDLIKEQTKSTFVFAQETVTSQMYAYGKRLLFKGELFDFEKKIDFINSITYDELNDCLKNSFDVSRFATSIVAKEPKIDL